MACRFLETKHIPFVICEVILNLISLHLPIDKITYLAKSSVCFFISGGQNILVFKITITSYQIRNDVEQSLKRS